MSRRQSTKGSSAVIVVILAIIAIIGALIWYLSSEPGGASLPTQTAQSETLPPQIGVSGRATASDLVSFSIQPGQTVSGVVHATGELNTSYFFEGNVVVNIVDANEAILRAGHGTATSDWMSPDPVSFSTDLDFSGLLPGPGFIALHNDNPSDMHENDKEILVPVVIR